MTIKFAENDGYLHDDGKPRVFTFDVDGRMFPCPADVSIGEFFARATKASAGATHTVGSTSEPVKTQPVLVAPSDPTKIERADFVRFLGFLENGQRVNSPDNEDLRMGEEYMVLEVGGKTLDIQSVTAPVQIRMTVYKTDVELARKGVRTTQRPSAFEKTATCSNCKETVVLTKTGDRYVGDCLKCKTPHAEAA